MFSDLDSQSAAAALAACLQAIKDGISQEDLQSVLHSVLQKYVLAGQIHEEKEKIPILGDTLFLSSKTTQNVDAKVQTDNCEPNSQSLMLYPCHNTHASFSSNDDPFVPAATTEYIVEEKVEKWPIVHDDVKGMVYVTKQTRILGCSIVNEKGHDDFMFVGDLYDVETYVKIVCNKEVPLEWIEVLKSKFGFSDETFDALPEHVVLVEVNPTVKTTIVEIEEINEEKEREEEEKRVVQALIATSCMKVREWMMSADFIVPPDSRCYNPVQTTVINDWLDGAYSFIEGIENDIRMCAYTGNGYKNVQTRLKYVTQCMNKEIDNLAYFSLIMVTAQGVPLDLELRQLYDRLFENLLHRWWFLELFARTKLNQLKAGHS